MDKWKTWVPSEMFEWERTAYRNKFANLPRARDNIGAKPMAHICAFMRDMGWSSDMYSDETLLSWFTPNDDQTLSFYAFCQGIVSNTNVMELMRARATRYYNGCDVDKNGGMTKEHVQKFFEENEDIVVNYYQYGDGSMQIKEFYTLLGCVE